MTRRTSLGSALMALLLGGCQQTLVLDDLSPDAGLSGTGGKSGTGSGGGGGPTDASSDGHCFGGQEEPIQFTADLPQLVVALDRSSAMNAPFGTSGPSQLQVALNAILGEVDGYSGKSSRRAIQFSFLDFPDGMAMDCNAASGCCPSDLTTTYTAFDLGASCNSSSTTCLQSTFRPIAEALKEVHDHYPVSNGGQHNTDRYVLLIADGDPEGSCSSADPCNDAIAEVGDLSNDLGVTTEVVEIGVGTFCLPELATATGISPSPSYVASTSTDLSNVLDDVAQTIAEDGCHLTLTTPPSGQLTVTFDNVVQPQDSGTTGNGWNYGGSNDTRLFLHGSLCQSFLQGSPNGAFGLQIYDGCASDHPGQNP